MFVAHGRWAHSILTPYDVAARGPGNGGCRDRPADTLNHRRQPVATGCRVAPAGTIPAWMVLLADAAVQGRQGAYSRRHKSDATLIATDWDIETLQEPAAGDAHALEQPRRTADAGAADIDIAEIPTLLPYVFLIDVLDGRSIHFRVDPRMRDVTEDEVTGRHVAKAFQEFGAEVRQSEQGGRQPAAGVRPQQAVVPVASTSPGRASPCRSRKRAATSTCCWAASFHRTATHAIAPSSPRRPTAAMFLAAPERRSVMADVRGVISGSSTGAGGSPTPEACWRRCRAAGHDGLPLWRVATCSCARFQSDIMGRRLAGRRRGGRHRRGADGGYSAAVSGADPW